MTPLEKTLKRELSIDGRSFIVAISPDSIKLTLKGKRNGQELKWKDWASGEAALALALNASLGGFAKPAATVKAPTPRVPEPAVDRERPAEPPRLRQPPATRRTPLPAVKARKTRGAKARR